MLGHVEPRDGALVSQEEPNGSTVIEVPAPQLPLLHTSPHSFSHAQLLQSHPAPLLFLSLGLQGRSKEGWKWRRESLGLVHSQAVMCLPLQRLNNLGLG